ncbi:MAG: N-acetylmuramoyl-L-alanine amidase [Herpetosiphonaceae bacterium]|nr:N-acetylmuramoyl-L-alanine amidase [Herpetosiphonaceae bacterium]
MTTNIDRTTWDTTQFRPVNNGYWSRANFGGRLPNRIVVHTTDGVLGSTFTGECRYLSDATNEQDPNNQVCAHYMIGKQGQCARLLDPRLFIAWAVGRCIDGWSNINTISIECHLTTGENWTPEMRATLESLVLELADIYPIQDLSVDVETHRHIALPPGRKQDPVMWSDNDFDAWRANLSLAAAPA